MHALALEDGRRWGEVAADFQLEDARAVLDAASPTPYHFLTRSRGGSKTADLAGMAIAAMLAQLPPASRLYGLAADRDQGRLLVESVEGYATRTPELRGALRVEAYRVTAARSGSVLEILPADAPGAWGLRPAFLVVDEIAQWGTTGGPRRLWEAATTAIGKVPGARMAVLTTAGDPAHWAHAILDHAAADRLWRVHEVRGPAPWLDAERLAEQRRRLPESSFARLFENVWTAPEDRLTAADDLAACTVLDGPLPPQDGCRYVIGLDVGTVNDRTAAIVAHSEPVVRQLEGGETTTGVRVIVDRIQVWAGSRASPVQLAEVGDWLDYVAREYNRATVVFDPFQAVELTQRLSKRGVRCEQYTFSAQSVGRLALTLYQLLRARALALPQDAELIDELANVRLRETSPGTYRIDHDAGRHDDRAIALALAARELVERGSRRGFSGLVVAVEPAPWERRPPTVEQELRAAQREKRRREVAREAWRRREAATFVDPRYA
jgi:phage terminase large subunit-like protein